MTKQQGYLLLSELSQQNLDQRRCVPLFVRLDTDVTETRAVLLTTISTRLLLLLHRVLREQATHPERGTSMRSRNFVGHMSEDMACERTTTQHHHRDLENVM